MLRVTSCSDIRANNNIFTILFSKSIAPSSVSSASSKGKLSKSENRKLQRAKKRNVEIDKMNADIKKPSAQQLSNKKDRKMIGKQVASVNYSNALKARNQVNFIISWAS